MAFSVRLPRGHQSTTAPVGNLKWQTSYTLTTPQGASFRVVLVPKAVKPLLERNWQARSGRVDLTTVYLQSPDGYLTLQRDMTLKAELADREDQAVQLIPAGENEYMLKFGTTLYAGHGEAPWLSESWPSNVVHTLTPIRKESAMQKSVTFSALQAAGPTVHPSKPRDHRKSVPQPNTQDAPFRYVDLRAPHAPFAEQERGGIPLWAWVVSAILLGLAVALMARAKSE